MKFRTEEEHKLIVKQYPYYQRRWRYTKTAINILRSREFETVLELGPGPVGVSVVHGADTMWINKLLMKPTYQHDAKKIPWPIADKQYDLFIALQVFEHLDGQQAVVFQEVRRIAKMALLSLPVKWGKRGNIHHVTARMIHDWTNGLKPAVICNTSKGKKPVHLLLWEF